MKRKFLVTLLAFIMAAICAVSMAACDFLDGLFGGTDTPTGSTKGEKVTAEQWKSCVIATLQAKNFTYEVKCEMTSGNKHFDSGKVIADMENNMAYDCAEEITIDGEGKETFYHSYEVYYQVEYPDLIMYARHIYGRETDEYYRVDDWYEDSYENCPQDFIKRPYTFSSGPTGAVFRSLEDDFFKENLGKKLEDAYDMFTYNTETGEYTYEVDMENWRGKISFKFNNGYISYLSTYGEYYNEQWCCTFSDYGTSKITVPQEVKDLMDKANG